MSSFSKLSKTFSKKKKKRRWFLGNNNKPKQKKSNQFLTNKKVNQIISQAKIEAQNILLNAKSDALEIKTVSENKAHRQQQQLVDRQTKINQKQTFVAQNQARIQTREAYLSSQKKETERIIAYIEDLKEKYLSKALNLAGTSEKEATEELFNQLQRRLEKDRASLIQAYEDQTADEQDTLIQDLLVTTMPHGSIDYELEYKSPIVRVNSKRVLQELRGTNDCNKEFLEKLAQVELVFEADGVIKINAQDSVDRELGRQVLEKVIKIGRINPARIRRIHQKISQDMNRKMLTAGTQLCHAVGVFKLPQDIMQKLGKFRYRFSYGQNMIEHTLEETLIGIALAHEFQADSNVVRLGCLFHDIGKVIHDDEGTHVETGVAYLKEMGIPQAVIDCVAQSHEDEPFSSIESIIVHIADGISGARPAARHNDLEFVNRVKYLETKPLEYPGVKDAYAIQAGREVRVFVDPNKIDDEEIKTLAKDLKEKIKTELTYPGSVTVNVIRELVSTVGVNQESKTVTKS